MQFYAACEQYQRLWSLQKDGLRQLAAQKNAKAAAVRARIEAKDKEHEDKMATYSGSGTCRSMPGYIERSQSSHWHFAIWWRPIWIQSRRVSWFDSVMGLLTATLSISTGTQRTLHLSTARMTGAFDSSGYVDEQTVELGQSGQTSRTQDPSKRTARFNPGT